MSHPPDDRSWMQEQLRDASAAQATAWETSGQSLIDPWSDPQRPDARFTPLARLAWLWLTAPEGFTARNTSLAAKLLRAASIARTGMVESIPGVPDAALMWLALHRQSPGQLREVDRATGILYREQATRGQGQHGDGGWMDAALSWLEQAIDRGQVEARASFPICRRMAAACLKHVVSPHRVWGNPKRERWLQEHSCNLLQRLLLVAAKAPHGWEVLSSVYGLSEPCYKMLADGQTTDDFRDCMRRWSGQMVDEAIQPGQATHLDPALLQACIQWPGTKAHEHMEKLRSNPEVVEHARMSTPWLYSHLTTQAATVSPAPSATMAA